MSISWFIRCLNDPITRQANKEDGCYGHFWEGWYKSHALLGDEALMTCLTNVELNPAMTPMAQNPAESEYTLIKDRSVQLNHSSVVSTIAWELQFLQWLAWEASGLVIWKKFYIIKDADHQVYDSITETRSRNGDYTRFYNQQHKHHTFAWHRIRWIFKNRIVESFLIDLVEISQEAAYIFEPRFCDLGTRIK